MKLFYNKNIFNKFITPKIDFNKIKYKNIFYFRTLSEAILKNNEKIALSLIQKNPNLINQLYEYKDKLGK